MDTAPSAVEQVRSWSPGTRGKFKWPSEQVDNSTMRRFIAACALGLVVTVAVGCQPMPPRPIVAATPTPAVPAAVPGKVMAPNRYTGDELGAWFASKRISGAKLSVAEVTELAHMFIGEGTHEGVTGDIAFLQAILETGWFRFSTRMPVHHHNFSGIGAVDSGSSSAVFRSRREGVRAQIQHLRAYSDPTVTVGRLNNPLVDPRFHLVSPKGRAPNWSQYGAGVWATDPGYAAKIASLHDELRTFVMERRVK